MIVGAPQFGSEEERFAEVLAVLAREPVAHLPRPSTRAMRGEPECRPWYALMTMIKRLIISRGGQVSVPAEVRRRWDTTAVLAEDHGDHLTLRPAPADPVAALIGAFADDFAHGLSTDDMRALDRAEDAEIEERQNKL